MYLELVTSTRIETAKTCAERIDTVTKFSHFQIDMSKCMVAFIDWYHLRINASEREKIKVN